MSNRAALAWRVKLMIVPGNPRQSKSRSMTTKTRATLEDLYNVEGKAELVGGEIVLMSPTGGVPGRAGGKIYRRL